jgi:hypothetical protein
MMTQWKTFFVPAGIIIACNCRLVQIVQIPAKQSDSLTVPSSQFPVPSLWATNRTPAAPPSPRPRPPPPLRRPATPPHRATPVPPPVARHPSPATAARDHTPAPSPCMGEAFARFPLTSSYGGTCSSRRRGWREARRMLRPYAHPAPPRHARPAARRPPPVARDRRPRPHARRPPSITPRPSSIFRRVDAPGASCYPGCNAMMKPSSREGRVTANRRWCEGGTRRSGEDPSERGEERLPLHSVAGR